jgi:hypothetical protein
MLAACAFLELLVLLAPNRLGVQGVTDFVTSPDTSEYLRVAQELVGGRLVATERTLGYPLFLSVGYLLGWAAYGMYWVLAGQLILNLLLTAMSWKLIETLAPAASNLTKLSLTGFFFLAGVGMSLYLLSDLLAAFFFGVFLYGFLFWRSWKGTILAGTALALATLVRPTFVLIPLLLPAASYFVRRCTSGIPWSQALALMLISSAGTGVNIWHQYRCNAYFGPSPIVAQNLERVLYMATGEGKTDQQKFFADLEAELGRRAGRPYGLLSETEQERLAKEVFFEQFQTHAPQIILLTVRTFVNYFFVPVESIFARVTALTTSQVTYERYVRPFVGVICLPIWVLCLIHPRGQFAQRRWYYGLILLMWIYLAGITALNPRQGERIRFPILAFLMPIAAWNIQTGLGYLNRHSGRLRQDDGFSSIQ